MMLIHAALAIVLFLGLVVAPAAAEAQAPAKTRRIGLLESGRQGLAADPFGQWGAFREGQSGHDHGSAQWPLESSEGWLLPRWEVPNPSGCGRPL